MERFLAAPYSTLDRKSVYSCFIDNYSRWEGHQKTFKKVGLL